MAGPTDRRVRVWFGRWLVAEYVADAAAAGEYEAAMRRRFASLRVTNEPVLEPERSEAWEW
ncbi:hypothetical protein [Kribbella sp. HUAS MG21]|uniref:Uncharacterized protein n=1 Tax=Kribbella sp. HUAS MG21 TaxID=3160966 RepID=A0AAU7TF57_9ACTN